MTLKGDKRIRESLKGLFTPNNCETEYKSDVDLHYVCLHNVNKAAHSGFETQRSHQQKMQNRGTGGPKFYTCWPKILIKNVAMVTLRSGQVRYGVMLCCTSSNTSSINPPIVKLGNGRVGCPGNSDVNFRFTLFFFQKCLVGKFLDVLKIVHL